MTHYPKILSKLRRPKILLRAARYGVPVYNRETDLQRITRLNSTASDTALIDTLVQQESSFEQARKTRDTAYNVGKHIRILTALLAEVANYSLKSRKRA
ncbi:MAG: hypothetical protein GY952_01600 [Rhodobacteraceae bacterium]|nr:hypothetical protein [Paracoccaceae bacterium]